MSKKKSSNKSSRIKKHKKAVKSSFAESAESNGLDPSNSKISVAQINQIALLIQQGRLAVAEKHLARLLARDSAPDLRHAELLHLSGVLKYQQQLLDEALQLIASAIEINPTAAEYHINLALVQRDNQQLSAALISCQQAITLEPHYPNHRYVLASIYLRQQNTVEAFASLKHCIENFPEFLNAYYLMADVLIQQDKAEEAVEIYQQCLTVAIDCPQTHLQLANCYLKLSRYQQAIQHFQQVLKLDKNAWQACQGMGLLCAEQGNDELAVKWYQRGLKLSPNEADLLHGVGVAYQKLGLYEASLNAYQSAIQNNAGLHASYHNLGNLQRVVGHYSAAQKTLAKLKNLNPQYPRLYSSMGHVYLDIGDHEKALMAFERGVEQDGDNFSRHMLNALSTQNKMRNGEIIEEEKAPAAYISELFDQYAIHFDNHLLESLNYQGPQIIRDLLEKLALGQTAKVELVLDLGCGTGLMGEVLHSRCEQLGGIDLSKNMLAVAERKQIYHRLICGDVVEFLRSTYQQAPLQQEDKQADLIVAFDVCNYFGDLKPLLQAIRASLKTGGIVLFSTERLDESITNPSQLQTTGRYSHSQAYILQLSEQLGFRVNAVEQREIRMELGQAVEGDIFTLSVL